MAVDIIHCKMGNDPSKPQQQPGPSTKHTHRSLPPLDTQKSSNLISRPVASTLFDNPLTPRSDITSSDTEDEGGISKPIASFETPLLPEDLVDEKPSDVRAHLLQLFVHESSPSVQLLVGFLDYPTIQCLTFLAKCIGFDSMDFQNPPVACFTRPRMPNEDHLRAEVAYQSLDENEDRLAAPEFSELDAKAEEALLSHLTQLVKSKMIDKGNVLEFNSQMFLLQRDTVQRIFQKVEKLGPVKLTVQPNKMVLEYEDEDAKPERAIQKGELVWRRLQHWSTNVRKEKKFNIWAKGLPEEVKDRIVNIAIEIGFETAQIQPNGNIHLEIKPPEGQHRRKLKHATDELRAELEPIDDAVCQNVEQHLQEWLAEFHKAGKQKEVLNCRFVLPAEWLRQTAERLAEQYGLKVKMETGIDLVFHRPDVDPTAVETPVSKEPSNKKTKPKSRSKKKNPDPPSLVEPTTNGHLPELPGALFEPRLGDPSHRLVPPQLNAARRPTGRNKYDYGWDPSWPTAHPDKSPQHSF